MTPAEIVIKSFGGVRATARIFKRSPSAVSQWKKKREYGLKGTIPASLVRKILSEAKKRNIKISQADLIFGRIGK